MSMKNPEPTAAVTRYDREIGEDWLDALGLARLSAGWAKIEIVGGLSAATLGMKLLLLEGNAAWGGAALIVLGLYLAMAGNRSHLYQAMNRQNALLFRMIRDLGTPLRDPS